MCSPTHPRPGTEAVALPELDPAVCRERSDALLGLDAELRLSHHVRAVGRGQPLEILFEQTGGGYMTGHTRDFMDAAVRAGGAETPPRGGIRRALPVGAEANYVICKLL